MICNYCSSVTGGLYKSNICSREDTVKPTLAPEGVLPLLFDGWRALALEKKENGQAKGEA